MLVRCDAGFTRLSHSVSLALHFAISSRISLSVLLFAEYRNYNGQPYGSSHRDTDESNLTQWFYRSSDKLIRTQQPLKMTETQPQDALNHQISVDFKRLPLRPHRRGLKSHRCRVPINTCLVHRLMLFRIIIRFVFNFHRFRPDFFFCRLVFVQIFRYIVAIF